MLCCAVLCCAAFSVVSGEALGTAGYTLVIVRNGEESSSGGNHYQLQPPYELMMAVTDRRVILKRQ
jgi:hypothetical protein